MLLYFKIYFNNIEVISYSNIGLIFSQKWTCHNVSPIIFLTICRMDVKYYFLEFALKTKNIRY